MPHFGRLLTAMATPMGDDGALDLDGAQALARHLIGHGTEGLVVSGTTGESPTLNHRETLDLFRAVVEAAGTDAQVVAGCGKNSTADTVGLVGEASELGVGGILLVSPYYNKPTQPGLRAHFASAAAATDLPVMLYDIPSRTAVEIAAETIVDLAESVPNIVAIKDAVANAAKTTWVIDNTPDDFEVYAGDDANALVMRALGARGLVSVAAHLVGDQLAEMLHGFDADPVGARAIHHRLAPLFSALFAETSPGPLKAALNLVGLPGGPVRAPLAPAEPATVALVRDALDHATQKATT